MAHRFDTGATVAQRTAIRTEVAAALGGLLKPTLPGGGALYLATVVDLAAPCRWANDDTEQHFIEEVAGRSPCVAIALGDRAFTSTGSDNLEWVGDLDVHVYSCSSAARSHVARMAGDVASSASAAADPGVETIAAHVFERLAGLPLRTATSCELRPTREVIALLHKDLTVIEQVYQVRVQIDVNPNRDLLQLVDSVDATHEDVDSPTVVAVARALSDLEVP